jgi:hypothetical protein
MRRLVRSYDSFSDIILEMHGSVEDRADQMTIHG